MIVPAVEQEQIVNIKNIDEINNMQNNYESDFNSNNLNNGENKENNTTYFNKKVYYEVNKVISFSTELKRKNDQIDLPKPIKVLTFFSWIFAFVYVIILFLESRSLIISIIKCYINVDFLVVKYK